MSLLETKTIGSESGSGLDQENHQMQPDANVILERGGLLKLKVLHKFMCVCV